MGERRQDPRHWEVTSSWGFGEDFFVVEAQVGRMGREQGKEMNYGQKERHIGRIRKGKTGPLKAWRWVRLGGDVDSLGSLGREFVLCSLNWWGDPGGF